MALKPSPQIPIPAPPMTLERTRGSFSGKDSGSDQSNFLWLREMYLKAFAFDPHSAFILPF